MTLCDINGWPTVVNDAGVKRAFPPKLGDFGQLPSGARY
jgi:hypothetical protein